MANRKIRIRPEGTNDYADVLHPETTASQVIQETNLRFITDAERVNWNGKLNSTAQAVDSAKLGGQLPSYYARTSDLVSIGYVTGQHAGTAYASKQINLGFHPTAVIQFTKEGVTYYSSNITLGGIALRNYPLKSNKNSNALVINTSGFVVYENGSEGVKTNSHGYTYHYIAFR